MIAIEQEVVDSAFVAAHVDTSASTNDSRADNHSHKGMTTKANQGKGTMKISENSAPGDITYTECDSPIGTLQIASNGSAIIALLMYEHRHAPDRANWRKVDAHEVPVLGEAVLQLTEYFNGTRSSFELPLAAEGTDMQKDVWKALSEIPFGETRSYGAIAQRIGRPTAVRAVGAANGKNPISIIVPCHRVIGANGSMTGFGGGIERKVWLLAHEARINPEGANAPGSVSAATSADPQNEQKTLSF